MRQQGFSLVVASTLILVIFLLSMTSLSMVNSSSRMTHAVYARSITINAAESGFQASTQTILDDAVNGFAIIMTTPAEEESFNDHGEIYWNEGNNLVFDGDLSYEVLGDVRYQVAIRDNNDLDENTTVDVDNRFILSAQAVLPDGGRSHIEIVVDYIGLANEYAQETGGSRSTSAFTGDEGLSNLGE